ncbi:MAG: nucleoside deaminase [Dehalococcoidia bacterium]
MDDERWLRRAFELAEGAADEGDGPFGAVLVGPDDRKLLESNNTVDRFHERLGHAELNVLIDAGRRWSLKELAACTLYSSTEPCPMCSGATAWSVNRLVFGLSQRRMYELFAVGWEIPRFGTPWDSRSLFDTVVPPMAVIGPLLETEAVRAHEKWLARWTARKAD